MELPDAILRDVRLCPDPQFLVEQCNKLHEAQRETRDLCRCSYRRAILSIPGVGKTQACACRPTLRSVSMLLIACNLLC